MLTCQHGIRGRCAGRRRVADASPSRRSRASPRPPKSSPHRVQHLHRAQWAGGEGAHYGLHTLLCTVSSLLYRTSAHCGQPLSVPGCAPTQSHFSCHTHTPTGKYTAHTVHWGTSLPPLSLSLSVLAAPWLATTLLLLLLLLAPAPRSKGGGGGSCRVGHR